VGLVHQAVPEAVMGDGRVQAWVIGPGLDVESTDPEAQSQVAVARAALASDLPVVIDAGGLDLIEGWRDAPTVVTPHAGELGRLLARMVRPGAEPGELEITAADVQAEPLRSARDLAGLIGGTVLLKGATTLVVTQGHPVRSQADAPPWLATAGAGDVLTGVIGALLAAGLEPHDAASLGALVHGVAADRVSGGGPLRALAVAHGIRPTVRDLLARGRALPG
jgi:NAD(P)H-hydrate repair Nnr-like enzyme with NAD(P)H-hydrate dehydratase domain